MSAFDGDDALVSASTHDQATFTAGFSLPPLPQHGTLSSTGSQFLDARSPLSRSMEPGGQLSASRSVIDVNPHAAQTVAAFASTHEAHMIGRGGIGLTTRVPSSMAASRSGIEYSNYVSPVLKVEELLHAHKNKHYQQWLKSQESAQRVAAQREALEQASKVINLPQAVEEQQQTARKDSQALASTPSKPVFGLSIGSSPDAFVSIPSGSSADKQQDRSTQLSSEYGRSLKSISSFVVAAGSREGSVNTDGFNSDAPPHRFSPRGNFQLSSEDYGSQLGGSVATYGSAQDTHDADLTNSERAVRRVLHGLITHVSVGVGVQSDPEAAFADSTCQQTKETRTDLIANGPLEEPMTEVWSPPNAPPRHKEKGIVLSSLHLHAACPVSQDDAVENDEFADHNAGNQKHRQPPAGKYPASAEVPQLQQAQAAAASGPTGADEAAASQPDTHVPQAVGDNYQKDGDQHVQQDSENRSRVQLSEEPSTAGVQATLDLMPPQQSIQNSSHAAARSEPVANSQLFAPVNSSELNGEVQESAEIGARTETFDTSTEPAGPEQADTDTKQAQVAAQGIQEEVGPSEPKVPRVEDLTSTPGVPAREVRRTLAAAAPAKNTPLPAEEPPKVKKLSTSQIHLAVRHILNNLVASIAQDVGRLEVAPRLLNTKQQQSPPEDSGTPRRTLPATESAVQVTSAPSVAGIQLSESEQDRVNLHVLKQYCQAHDQKRLPKIEALWSQHKHKLWVALEKKHPGTTQKFISAADKLAQKLRARKAAKLVAAG